MRRRIVIIGGNIAGLTAAISAREVDKHAEITVLSREAYPPYRRSSLVSIISAEATTPKDLIMSPSQLRSLRIRLLQGVEALDIDCHNRIVKARGISMRRDLSFYYDSLVLASGSLSLVPPIEGVKKKGVFTFRTLEDALRISQEAKLAKKVVVVGAGLGGLEVAEALAKRGVKVTIAVRSRILRKLVEPNLSVHLRERIEQKGVKVITGVSPEKIGGEKKVEWIKLSKEKISTSNVIFSTGVKPNVELAKKIGLELGETGAIKVDYRMQTTISEIYAAGDCAEAPDALTGKWMYVPVGSVAAKEGAVAGKNAAGDEAEVRGIIRAQADTIFGKEIVSIGHSSESARKLNVKANAVNLSSMWRSLRFLQKHPAKIMVLITPNGRIIGAQVISHRFASLYAYTLFSAIQQKITLDELLDKWQPWLNILAKYA